MTVSIYQEPRQKLENPTKSLNHLVNFHLIKTKSCKINKLPMSLFKTNLWPKLTVLVK